MLLGSWKLWGQQSQTLAAALPSAPCSGADAACALECFHPCAGAQGAAPAPPWGMEQRQAQEKPIRRHSHTARSPHGEERGEFFTLHTPGWEQEAAILLLTFCSWQRALTPGWVTGFIVLRKIELICFLNFNLSLFFGFVQFFGSLITACSSLFLRILGEEDEI